jgi:hypothetical protein
MALGTDGDKHHADIKVERDHGGRHGNQQQRRPFADTPIPQRSPSPSGHRQSVAISLAAPQK